MSFYKKINAIDFYAYIPRVIITVSLIVLLSLLAIGYRFYQSYNNRLAQKVFGQYLEQLRNETQTGSVDWQRAASEFENLTSSISTSKIGAYAALFQVKALLAKNDVNGALNVLEKTIASLSTSSPLYHLIKTQQALILLDVDNELVHLQGLKMLTDLAHDQKNAQKDVALYYLGYFNWVNNNLEQAKTVWQELVDEYRHEQIAPSVWAALAKEKLVYLT